MQAIGQERHEDVRLDAPFQLMMDRAEGQVVLQGLERRLDLDELDVEAPQLGGIASAQVGAQQIAALPAPNPSELRAVERVAEARRLSILSACPRKRRSG